ncbi:MAG: hypothetical protein AB7H92_14060 [Microbacteriaceae bacterium]
MAYVDLNTIHTPRPRAKPPATWGAQVRENFDFLHTNRRVICTSSTRPTGFEGLEIYETDTDLSYIHNGTSFVEIERLGAWLSVTPTLVQSGAVTKTTTYARYRRNGRSISYQGLLSVTGTGTGSNAVLVGTGGITAVQSGGAVVGSGYIYDASANLRYPAVVALISTTTLGFVGTNGTSAANLGAADFTAGLASGDVITWAVEFEAATSA